MPSWKSNGMLRPHWNFFHKKGAPAFLQVINYVRPKFSLSLHMADHCEFPTHLFDQICADAAVWRRECENCSDLN